MPGTERIDTGTPSPWLTIGDAAAYVQTSPRTLYRECRAGRLRHARIGGRREVRVRREWLDEWLLATSEPVEVHR